jgi:hypothetical protein
MVPITTTSQSHSNKIFVSQQTQNISEMHLALTFNTHWLRTLWTVSINISRQNTSKMFHYVFRYEGSVRSCGPAIWREVKNILPLLVGDRPPSNLTEDLVTFAIYNSTRHLQTTHISIMMTYKNSNKLGSVDSAHGSLYRVDESRVTEYMYGHLSILPAFFMTEGSEFEFR